MAVQSVLEILAEFSVADLVTVQKNIGQLIEQRQVAERTRLRQEILKMVSESGLSLTEVLEPGKKTVNVAAAKYANPTDVSQTWTGRGRKPAWVVAHLNSGGTLESLAI